MVLGSVSCAVLGHQPHCAGSKRLLGDVLRSVTLEVMQRGGQYSLQNWSN